MVVMAVMIMIPVSAWPVMMVIIATPAPCKQGQRRHETQCEKETFHKTLHKIQEFTVIAAILRHCLRD